jgi:hypothetical protein
MTSSSLHATLKLRSFPSYGITDVRHRTLARLHRLADEGVLSTVDVDVWGSHAVADSMADRDTTPVEGVSDFERWAADHGCTLAPAFARRECGSLLGDEPREVTVVPLLTLAVYEEDELRAVYPHAEDGTVHTVDDGLETLETMEPPTEDRTGSPANEPTAVGSTDDRPVAVAGR